MWDASTKTARVLLGRWKGGDEPVRVALTHLEKMGLTKAGEAVQVRVERIVPSGWSVSEGPQVELDKVMTLDSRNLEFTLPELGRNDACAITITHAPSTK